MKVWSAACGRRRISAGKEQCCSNLREQIYPDDAEDAQKLISCADFAMYEVKQTGRNNFRYSSREPAQEVAVAAKRKKRAGNS